MLLAFFVGIILGIVFFGGLYVSGQKMNKVKHPGLFMAASFFVRIAIVAAGVFLIRDGGFQNMLLALGGMILVRLVMTAKVKKRTKNAGH